MKNNFWSWGISIVVLVCVVGLLMFNFTGKVERKENDAVPSITNAVDLVKRKAKSSTNQLSNINHVIPGETAHRALRPSLGKTISKKKKTIPPALLKEFLRKAIDEDNEKDVLTWASLAHDAESAELRLEAVNALGWYGENALPEMLPFLEDPDKSVALEAFNQIDQALDMLDDDKTVAKLVKLAMNYATDEDQAVVLLSKLEGVSETEAVTALADMLRDVEKDTVLDELLRDEYSHITEIPYYSDTSARVWIQQNKMRK